MHVHAVVRLDGPDGPETAPTAWATAELLAEAVAHAAARVAVTVEGPSGHRPGRSVGRADRWATHRPRSRVRGGVLMGLPVIYHVSRREIPPQTAFSATFGLLAAFVAFGRFVLAPF